MPSDLRNKRVLMLSHSIPQDDIRIKKEAESLSNCGYSVKVLGISKNHDHQKAIERNSVCYESVQSSLDQNLSFSEIVTQVKSSWAFRNKKILKLLVYFLFFAAKPFQSVFLKRRLNQLFRGMFICQIYEYLVTSRAKSIQPDVVHAHDLTTLSAAHRVAVELHVPLIYDSHELESHRGHENISVRVLWRIFTEKIFLTRFAHIISVSQGITEILARRYKPASAVTILNSAYGTIGNSGQNVRSDLGISDDVPIIIYVGKARIGVGQGIDEVFDALKIYEKAHFAIIGPRGPENDADIYARVRWLGIQDRVHLLNPKPVRDLVEYIQSASLAVILFSLDRRSWMLSLPNKFFEVAFARLPIILRKGLVEMETICDKYSFGYFVEDLRSEELSGSMKEVIENRESFRLTEKCKEEMIDEYSWERQEVKLRDFYQDVLK